MRWPGQGYRLKVDVPRCARALVKIKSGRASAHPLSTFNNAGHTAARPVLIFSITRATVSRPRVIFTNARGPWKPFVFLFFDVWASSVCWGLDVLRWPGKWYRLKVDVPRCARALVKVKSGRASARPLLIFTTAGHTPARPRLILTRARPTSAHTFSLY